MATVVSTSVASKATTPQRQIRASYDSTTITVYQAYSTEIAEAAITHQKLSASSKFRCDRMTWIKPSWCWMMYRSGYSYKDPNQKRILAIKMRREDFLELLGNARLASTHKRIDGDKDAGNNGHDDGKGKGDGSDVIVQWDPERGLSLEKLDYRSIQIGIKGEVKNKWIDEWILGIEDVTERARGMKRLLDDNNKNWEGRVDRLVLEEMGLMPIERVFEVNEEIMRRLHMSVI